MFPLLVLLQVLLMCGRDSTLPVLLCGVGGDLIVSQGRDCLPRRLFCANCPESVVLSLTRMAFAGRDDDDANFPQKRILSSGVVFINLGMLGNHAREIESARTGSCDVGCLDSIATTYT